MFALSPQQIAWRVARDLRPGTSVCLGPGLPRLVAAHLSPGHTVVQDDDPDVVVVEAREVDPNGQVACDATSPLHGPLVVQSQLHVMLPLFDARGVCGIREHCGLPVALTAPALTLYTDLAVFDVREGVLTVCEIVEGVTLYSLQAEMDVELRISPTLRLLQAPRSARD